MSIVDEPVYPWPDPLARELHVTLTQLNPTPAAANLMAAQAGIDTTMINLVQPVYLVWADILTTAAPNGQTRELVKTVRDRLNATSPRRPFLDALLADERPPVESEPRGAGGAPAFLTGDDEITEPEALLYVDDLTIQIGRVPALIKTLQRLVVLAPTVCRMVVDVNGQGRGGSGFRISKDRILTNHHVLHIPDDHDGIRATAATAEFGYVDDGAGGVLAAIPIKCNVTTIVASAADDWAVIQASEPLRDEWPIVKLSDAAAPEPNGPAFIIQHPLGERKRLGFVRNQISDFTERTVHYLTDTQEGSSGSPVFDAAGRLIALHHAGGRAQEVIGRPPIKKNEGIRIPVIAAGIKAAGIPVP